MSGIHQCCYTNAQVDVDGVSSPGWQAVAVSSGMPAAAYTACTRLQSINSSMGGTTTDEQGRVLNLLEVQGDDSYLYLLRTQYGLLDRVGRANMFSHGLVVPWAESGALRDPNVFLAIADENFKASTAEATGVCEHLVREGPFDLTQTLSDLDIDPGEYLTLIQCVYAKMTERFVTSPLYVQYDGTNHQLRQVLYCIYRGLPYHLRKRLSVASCETQNTTDKSLVFSIRASRHQFFVVPGTGENNVISKRLERKIARVGFADYAVRNLGKIDLNRYFDALEQAAVSLGDEKASSPLVLKVAHRMITAPDISAYDNELLEMAASDALMSALVGAQGMERHVAQLLEECNVRDLDLTEGAEAYLDDWLAQPMTEELAAAGERYRVRRFSQMPEDQAAAKLAQMRSEFLDRYLMRLAESERGCAIVDRYFEGYAVPVASSSWEGLARVLDESRMVPDARRTDDALQEAAWRLYCSSIDDIALVDDTYTSYVTFMQRLLVAEDLPGCEQAAREEFWQRVSYDNLDFGHEHTYRRMAVEGVGCDRMLDVFELRATLGNARGTESGADVVGERAAASTTVVGDASGEPLVEAPASLSDAPLIYPIRRVEGGFLDLSADGRFFAESSGSDASEDGCGIVSVPGRGTQADECAERFLKALSHYVGKYFADISEGQARDEQASFRRLLSSLVEDAYVGKDCHLRVWVNAVVCLPSVSKELDGLLDLRRCVNEALSAPEYWDYTYENLEALYQEARAALEGGSQRSELHDVDELVYQTVALLDDHADAGSYVPLDLWMAVGVTRHRNPFELFDDIEPGLLTANPVEVVRNSRYLKTLEGQDLAGAYVRRRDSLESGTVKGWLKAYKELTRKPKSRSGLGGLVSGLASRFKQPEASEDEADAESDAGWPRLGRNPDEAQGRFPRGRYARRD